LWHWQFKWEEKYLIQDLVMPKFMAVETFIYDLYLLLIML
jgi:hypothetical protein